jgi:uncharacterized repeat protein (TIGR01451 family)
MTGGSFNLDSSSYTFKVTNAGNCFAENATFKGTIKSDTTLHIESVDFTLFEEEA